MDGGGVAHRSRNGEPHGGDFRFNVNLRRVWGEPMNRLLAIGISAALLVVLAACGAADAHGEEGGGATLTRDAAIGTKFGAPGPRSCSSTSQPSRGPISAAQARAYVICGYEKEYQGGSDNLYLVSHVQVQVSNGRPYEHVRDSFEQIDPHKQVYDIRGNSIIYQCSLPGAYPASKASLCRRTINQNDKGICYQTTFNEWRCTWGDLTAPMTTDTRTLVPVPSEADLQ